ncbi:MAG: hypothetical protein K2P35_07480, partial [Lachnospiraceae bacterium]|nr:hypothetical protein [Lachnospiraceae bacterium]
KYGTNVATELKNYEKLKGSAIRESLTKEDEAFALLKAIEHFSAPSREDLYEYFNEMRQSDFLDKKQKKEQKDRQLEDLLPTEIHQKRNRVQEKEDKQSKDASWDALIQKLCQFFIDYTRDPAETLNRFMIEYSDILHKIQGDITNSYHNELNELLNTSEKPIIRHIFDELANERSSKEYTTLNKYLKAKDNHIEIYRNFLLDENNSGIRFVDTDGEEVSIKNIIDMNKTEFDALVDLIDSGRISMSVNGKCLDSLKNDAYMNIHCNQNMMHRFEKQNMQLLKEELNMFRSMNGEQKKEYIEKNGFDLNAARAAYRYSFHKVNAMENDEDITSAAMEQLGLSFEKKGAVLDKRIDAYLASQKLHYEHYSHIFDKAIASGEPITIFNYKNKCMNSVKIGQLSELSPADRMALADLIDHDRIFMYVGDKKIEPVYDQYTNPD